MSTKWAMPPARAGGIAGFRPKGPRALAIAPHLADPFEAKLTLGRFGEVKFATFDIGPAIDHRHAHGVPTVAKRHERAARQRLVRDAERRAGQLTAAGKAASAAVPGGVGQPVGGQAPN